MAEALENQTAAEIETALVSSRAAGLSHSEDEGLGTAGVLAATGAFVVGGMVIGLIAVHKGQENSAAPEQPTPRPVPSASMTHHLRPSSSIHETTPDASPTSLPSTPATSPTSTAISHPNTSTVTVSPPKQQNPKITAIERNFMVGFDASTPKNEIDHIVKAAHPGGIYLIGTTDAMAAGFTPAYYSHLSELAGGPLVVASDEEGAYVHRLAYNFNLPSALEMGRMSDSQVAQIGRLVGQQMIRDGVYVDFAPVLDSPDTHDVIHGAISRWQRSFGGGTNNIIDKAQAFNTGLQQSGVLSIVKHWPSINQATPNSDTDSHAAKDPSVQSMESTSMLPFEPFLRSNLAKGVMVGNPIVKNLTNGVPASLSPASYQMIRQGYAFEGAAFTDSLTGPAKYLQVPLWRVVATSVEAGADAPLFDFNADTAPSAIATIRTAARVILHHVSADQIAASAARLAPFRHTS